MASVIKSINKAHCDKLCLSSLDLKPLEDACRIYRVIAHNKEKVFLRRNLLYRKSCNKNKPLQSRKRSHSFDSESSVKCSKIESSSSSLSFPECLGLMKHDGMDLTVCGLEDIDDVNEVEIEASVVKLNGCITQKVIPLDSGEVNCLGTLKINTNPKNSPTKRNQKTNQNIIHIPQSAFTPINGHSSWYSWLIIKCTWSRSEKCDHSLRRLGYRQSSNWPLNIKNAALPLCKGGETLLTDGKMDIKLWSTEKNDVHLGMANVIKSVFCNRNKCSPYKHTKNSESSNLLPCLKVELCWRDAKFSPNKSTNNYNELANQNNFASIPKTVAPACQLSKVSNGFSNKNNHLRIIDTNSRVSRIRSLRQRIISPALVSSKLAPLNGNGSKNGTPIKNGKNDVNILEFLDQNDAKSEDSTIPRNLIYNFHCRSRIDDDETMSEAATIESTSHSEESGPKSLKASSSSIKNSAQFSTNVENGSRCPFCDFFAEDLYFLLKHLTLCHDRFLFQYREVRGSSKTDFIDVCAKPNFNHELEIPHVDRSIINNYRSRKSRSPRRMGSQPVFGFVKSQTEKLRRPLKQRSLMEFQFKNLRAALRKQNNPVVVRQYYHSQTCAPLLAGETNSDSEDETDPKWLRITRTKMIDEFTDVNDGEKNVMKLWNLHMMKYNFFGDNRIFAACSSFLNAHLDSMALIGGFSNFKLHLVNLASNFGLLSAKQLFTLTARIQSAQERLKKTNNQIAMRQNSFR